ncbi:uncharacterized protein LOC116345869 [Contarinia nasturtii]|uniref:uncharacterized protein LOC116345869 n=1 Tax=Contarinia nasturtii TaxID=265458 RepID=UPI0012D434AA|nr:uncharacterized protein LOC116345869 [Contarinia nasturtii]
MSAVFAFSITVMIVFSSVYGNPYGSHHVPTDQYHNYPNANHQNANYPRQINANTLKPSSDYENSRFEEFYRWKQISYRPLENESILFGLADRRLNDLTASDIRDNYIPYNNLPMGMMHHPQSQRIFITLPRRRIGMPATITYVSSNGARGSSPSLQAYPSFRANELHPQNQPDRNRIVSVYRSRIDSCNRLWFVDTGSLEYPGNTIQVQPPSIWIFDLTTDLMLRRFEIPTANVLDGHGIASITIDIDENRCDDAFAYLPDLVNYRLHVYSLRTNQFWTFSHNYLHQDPLRGDFDVAGVQYQWNDGIFSIQLSARNADGFKTAYFHAMASTSEFEVSTQVLKNQTASTRSNHGSDFKYVGQRSTVGQSAMHAYDKNTGIMFFSQVSLNGIGCWDTTMPLNPDNLHLIAQDNTTMIYPSDINIDSEGVIWVMTNNLPLYNYATIDPNEFNYRIWRAPVQRAIRGTPCEIPMYTEMQNSDQIATYNAAIYFFESDFRALVALLLLIKKKRKSPHKLYRQRAEEGALNILIDRHLMDDEKSSNSIFESARFFFPNYNDGVLFPDNEYTSNVQPNYIPTNVIPIGVSHYKNKLFLTAPRRRVGVPSTLNFIYTKSSKGSSPSYRPFPNAEINELDPNLQPNPNKIISVYRTRVDDCNRLWWIDTGILEYPNNATQVQRPSIWVYDLENEKVLHRFEIAQSVVERGNGLASITVDADPNNCQNTYAYIPDLATYRLYVYSLSQNRIWTFQHNYFHFDPVHGDFNIDGIPFQWDDGIFSITLGKRNADGYRTAYFHAMASVTEFSVSTKVLQNEQNAGRSNHGTDFEIVGQRAPFTQSNMHDFDKETGVIFYTQIWPSGVGCWNTKKSHVQNNFKLLAHNNRTMIYPSDISVDQEGNVWMFTNTMTRWIYSQMNWNEYNFRVWKGNARELVKGTQCERDHRG